MNRRFDLMAIVVVISFAVSLALVLTGCGDNIKPPNVDDAGAVDATCPVPPADETPMPEECRVECRLEKCGIKRHWSYGSQVGKPHYRWKCVEICESPANGG